MKEQKLAAQVLIFFLLVFALPSINNQIQTNAQSENATAMDKFGGTVLPLFLSTLVFAFLGAISYQVLKGMS